jgi:hypothetical protein
LLYQEAVWQGPARLYLAYRVVQAYHRSYSFYNAVYPCAGKEQPVNKGFLHPPGPGAFHVRVVGGKDGRAVRVNGGHNPRKGLVLFLPVMQGQLNLGRPEGVKYGFQSIHASLLKKTRLIYLIMILLSLSQN